MAQTDHHADHAHDARKAMHGQSHGHHHDHDHDHEAASQVAVVRPDTARTGRGLRAIVYGALPADATPVGTLTQPVHRHVLDNAQGDVVQLTAARMSEEFGATPHVILALEADDLDPGSDGDLYGVLSQTDGGLVVFGVSYSVESHGGEPAAGTQGPEDVYPAVSGEACEECGSTDAFEISRSDSPDTRGMWRILVECRECGAVWDSFARG